MDTSAVGEVSPEGGNLSVIECYVAFMLPCFSYWIVYWELRQLCMNAGTVITGTHAGGSGPLYFARRLQGQNCAFKM